MPLARRRVLITDGEGPLVLKDLARDIAGQIHQIYEPRVPRHLLFDTLSLFNAFLAEEGHCPNQPGDTVALLVPHLLAHGVSDQDLRREAVNTVIAKGSLELLDSLKQRGWGVHVVSSAYSALWEVMGPRFHLSLSEISSSALNLEELRRTKWNEVLTDWLKIQEMVILQDHKDLKSAIQMYQEGRSISDIWHDWLNETFPVISNFYDYILPSEGFDPLKEVTVVGGSRKVDAIRRIQAELQVGLQDIVFVGDSITDDQALKCVRENGGLAIALNGDRYAVRNAEIAVALEDRRDLVPILEAWSQSGIEGIRPFAESQQVGFGKERVSGTEGPSRKVDFVNQGSIEGILQIHKEFRKRDRETPPLI